MSKLTITGYGDDLTINDTRIGDLTPLEHTQIEEKLGGKNYSPLENVVVSHAVSYTHLTLPTIYSV